MPVYCNKSVATDLQNMHEWRMESNLRRGGVWPKRTAFTLLELLVVVAVIVILAAIALPAIAQARMDGKKAHCISNMQQIGIGMLAFAAEHDGVLPETTHTTGGQIENSWIYTLAPYLEQVDKVRICPADPHGQQRLEAKGTSYVLNSFLFVPEYDPFGDLARPAANRLAALPRPASTMMAFIISDGASVGVQNDHTHSNRWKIWDKVLADICPDRFRVGLSNVDQTAGSSNYLFVDGHVENLSAKTIKARIDAGDNIAQLPNEDL